MQKKKKEVNIAPHCPKILNELKKKTKEISINVSICTEYIYNKFKYFRQSYEHKLMIRCCAFWPVMENRHR